MTVFLPLPNRAAFSSHLLFVFALLLLFGVAFPLASAAALFPGRPTHLVVFGDSWSDTGNAHALSHGAFPRSPLYADGQYSNGPIWIRTIVQDRFLGTNFSGFAFGSATSNSDTVKGYLPNGMPVPSVKEQISNDYANFVTTTKGVGDAPMFAMWSGAYDYIFGNEIFKQNLTPETIASDIMQNAETLIRDFSAQRILLLTIPPLARLPLYRGADPAAARRAGAFTATANALLQQQAAALESRYADRDARVLVFDVGEVVAQMEDLPGRYGLENAVDACVGAFTGMVCERPEEFLFYDDRHFSEAANAVVGEAVGARVAMWLK
ncbi:hypothetical protein DFJ73DRAFT_942981 [Zopfochytrium polystomum]|nr:hypothetical protein DFJ73DRAFT_942981 [Zopfochytrium polystomum]